MLLKIRDIKEDFVFLLNELNKSNEKKKKYEVATFLPWTVVGRERIGIGA